MANRKHTNEKAKPAMQRRVIGLCGGIGCGKSARLQHLVRWWESPAAAAAFPQIAFAWTDADKVGHGCYAPGTECYKNVVRHFGEGILADPPAAEQATGLREIDRKKLGAAVFGTGRMPELNAIVWPAIAAAVEADITHKQRLAASGSNDSGSGSGSKKTALVYVVEAAILPEMPQLLQLCDEVWLFQVAQERAVERVVHRNKVTPEEALRRVLSQSTAEEKARLVTECAEQKRRRRAQRAEEVVETADAASPPLLLRRYDTTDAVTEEQFQASLLRVEQDFKEMLTATFAAGESK